MSDENRSANVKVQFTGAEIAQHMDALQRIADAVKSYEKIMFLGGPMPSAVALELRSQLESKLKDAPAIGAPSRTVEQR